MMIYRVTIAYDLEAENDALAQREAQRLLDLSTQLPDAEIVSIEDENWQEIEQNAIRL